MPHTTTKSQRTNRPDTRPNAKSRIKEMRKVDKETTIQEIKVTKIKNSEKKERIAQPTEFKKAKLVGKQKRLRTLKKKLESIQELQRPQQEEGKQLDAQQLVKVNSLDDVMKEIETLLVEDDESKEADKKLDDEEES